VRHGHMVHQVEQHARRHRQPREHAGYTRDEAALYAAATGRRPRSAWGSDATAVERKASMQATAGSTSRGRTRRRRGPGTAGRVERRWTGVPGKVRSATRGRASDLAVVDELAWVALQHVAVGRDQPELKELNLTAGGEDDAAQRHVHTVCGGYG
jgi:hypothetical protein